MANRRQKISIADKNRLTECFQRGDDYIDLARILGIKRGTAYSIVRRCQQHGVVARPRAFLPIFSPNIKIIVTSHLVLDTSFQI